MTNKQTTALALYSGGLDSTLACRVVMAQSIRVLAVKFVTPFFGYDLLAREEEYTLEVKEKFGIDVFLHDITKPYLKMVRNPAHGYGKNFNPCVDCKILLLSEARKMMPEMGASFLVTGEVVGQRPMSQRRDTLRTIERESGCEGILVRPLCAKNLEPTQAELAGLIDREQLLDFSGRNRKPQMHLAEKFGIEDYPSPAGGCTLTDPIHSIRIKDYYEQHENISAADIRLLMVGRQFKLPAGGWLIVGRNHKENLHIENLVQPGDWIVRPDNFPGPSVLLRYSNDQKELQLAAGILARYSKKSVTGQGTVKVIAEQDGKLMQLETMPLDDQAMRPWQL
jgi:tRNA U34 2-thiouridine synthase MnmA/TrmU